MPNDWLASNDARKQAVWTLTDYVAVRGRELGLPAPFVAHDAEGVVLVAASGPRADDLRRLIANWEGQPDSIPRPASPVVLS